MKVIFRLHVNIVAIFCNCNTNKHVRLHRHILDFILTPDSSFVSNIRVSEFISDHVLVLGQLVLLSTAQYVTHIEGYMEWGVFFLYTTAPPDHGFVSKTSSFSLISRKLCNLQICIIYH